MVLKMHGSNIVKSSVVIFFLSGTGLYATAQQAQVVFEDPWFSGEWLSHVVSTTDNGQVIGINGDRKIKLDVSGNALWCRSYEFGAYQERAMPDGGTISMSYPTFYLHFAPLQDTLEMQCSLMKLDANGDVEWAKTLSAKILGDVDLPGDLYGGGRLEADDEGRIALALQCNAMAPRPMWVIELDQDGTVVWSRILSDPEPRLSDLSIALDGDGAVYLLSWYGPQDFWDPVEFDLIKLSMDGELDWMRRGTFLQGGGRGSSLICSNGHPVIGGLEEEGSNFHAYVISVQSNGALGWLKEYSGPGTTNDNQAVWQLRALANGELIAAHYTQNDQWSEDVIAYLAEDGGVIDAARVLPMNVAGCSFHANWAGVDVRGSTVAIATDVHRQAPWDFQPGLAGLWTLGLDLNGCMLAPVTVGASSFNSLVTLVAVNPLISSEPGLDTVSIAVSMAELVAPPTGDACSLPMYIAPPTLDLGTFDVRPTMVARGNLIQIRSSSAGTLEIRDVMGRCFSTLRIVANVSAELNTSELCSGTYLLCMTNGAGIQERVRKVLVE